MGQLENSAGSRPVLARTLDQRLGRCSGVFSASGRYRGEGDPVYSGRLTAWNVNKDGIRHA